MTALTCDEVRDLAPLFVLGALEPDEAEQVRLHLATCADAHDEVTELGGVLPYLDESVPQVEPPARLRSRLMAAAADLAERESAASPPPVQLPVAPIRRIEPLRPDATAPAPVVTSSAPIPFRPRRSVLRPAWLAGIAAVLAIVALGVWNVRLQQDLSTARSYQENVASVIAAAGQTNRLVVLTASPDSAGAHGLAAVGPVPGQLVMSGLTPTPAGKVYEAWVITGGAAPVPAGWFTVDASGTGYLASLKEATGPGVTVAITLETQKDPPTPTAPVLASGQAS